MVFGRGKKKDNRVMMPPDLYAQYAAMQQMSGALPPMYPQPAYQQPAYQQPQMQQPMPQMVQQPVMPVRPPVYPGMQDGQPVPLAEQLMQSFLTLVDKFKESDVRLLKLETVVNDLFDRLNQLQGVQPVADKRIAFPKRK